jgi:hypothetical protein
MVSAAEKSHRLVVGFRNTVTYLQGLVRRLISELGKEIRQILASEFPLEWPGR